MYTVKYMILRILCMISESMASSTMRINDDTKRSIIKIGADLSVRDGRKRSLEDTVKFLIDYYKKKRG
jgi:hypothetical protein